jgi:cytochrome c oxidase cbb3-type subunit 3
MNTHEKEKTNLEILEDERHLLLEHSYDGIQELNHPLPGWWNFIFYAAIVYSAGYFVYYQFLSGPSLREEFMTSHAKILAAQAEYKKINSAFKLDEYNQILADDGVKKGAIVFENNCLPCHNENAKGDVGPNLTDEYWLLAKGTPETIYNVAFNGSEENGMPAWSELLPKEEILQAVAYVSSLKNTHQKGGKAPQGIKVEE